MLRILFIVSSSCSYGGICLPDVPGVYPAGLHMLETYRFDYEYHFLVQPYQYLDNNNNNNNDLFAPFCTKKYINWIKRIYSDWAPEMTRGTNLVGCPLYKVLICETNNQRYMEGKQ